MKKPPSGIAGASGAPSIGRGSPSDAPRVAGAATPAAEHTDAGAADERPLAVPQGQFLEWQQDTWFEVTQPDAMPAFLMALATDSDVWMFVSSNGGLTTGRGTPDNALLPYETVDKLHDAHLHTGSVTLLRVRDDQGRQVLWEPFAQAVPGPAVTRRLCKNTTGCRVLFEETHAALGLTWRVSWSSSERLGVVRRVTLVNREDTARSVQVVDGLRNILPYGAPLGLQQNSSSLVDAYKRADLDPHTHLATYSLTAKILDRAEAGEVLRANVAWCAGLSEHAVCLGAEALDAFRRGVALPRQQSLKGRRGNYLISMPLELAAGEEASWHLVADVGLSHVQLARLRVQLMQTADLVGWIESQVSGTRTNLRRLVTSADGLQVTAQRATAEHHFANVLFNCMRGGVFVDNGRVPRADLQRFLQSRNRKVAERHAEVFGAQPDAGSTGVSGSTTDPNAGSLSGAEVVRRARATGDPDLQRLCYEYLPLTFGRRHGDPSRPWNRFDIRVHNADGSDALNYEGNWRDIFQNWEALSWSWPEFLPHFVAKFVNASTLDGFNPYRIDRQGIDWEVVDEDDPWSNIGYWGDHQIVYLLKFLETLDRFEPEAFGDLLLRDIFSYADVPYRLESYRQMVQNPHETIRFDRERAKAVAVRVEAIGSDGRLVADAQGNVVHVTLVEKLLVPALSKLSNLVVDAGIWMNTQRPEWNDANNALVGNGVSMVTLCYLRRYLAFLDERLLGRFTEARISSSVVTWLQEVLEVLEKHQADLQRPTVSDAVRRRVLDALGGAFEKYRMRVTTDGPGEAQSLPADDMHRLCRVALDYLDHAIRANRRDDGLWHAYNLIAFEATEADRADEADKAEGADNADNAEGTDGGGIAVQRLPEMLEGQVAVLSSGVLRGTEAAQLVDALYDSALYRVDQNSFQLYPESELPGFMERNVVPTDEAFAVPLLQALLDAGDTRLVERDALGILRFQADIENADDVDAILDRLAADDRWRPLVHGQRSAVQAVYESVFQHSRFTGRSGTMYAYEGLGSIYWHMVAKLLLAVQENVLESVRRGEPGSVVARLAAGYERIRSGLGFTKSVAGFGAIPIDPYSHTPAHSGAKQPGMTGQVKEEILTRFGELGVHVDAGRLSFQPLLLGEDEFLDAPAQWDGFGLDGDSRCVPVPAGSLAFGLCQVPVLYEPSDTAWIRVVRQEKTSSVSGDTLDVDASRDVFTRSGSIVRIEVGIPREHLRPSGTRPT